MPHSVHFLTSASSTLAVSATICAAHVVRSSFTSTAMSPGSAASPSVRASDDPSAPARTAQLAQTGDAFGTTTGRHGLVTQIFKISVMTMRLVRLSSTTRNREVKQPTGWRDQRLPGGVAGEFFGESCVKIFRQLRQAKRLVQIAGKPGLRQTRQVADRLPKGASLMQRGAREFFASRNGRLPALGYGGAEASVNGGSA
jgi:hypothetical protein